jgi:hypothetical protein
LAVYPVGLRCRARRGSGPAPPRRSARAAACSACGRSR